jgi:hypothetical protein
MKNKGFIIGASLILTISTLVLMVMAQNNTPLNSKKQLIERLEKAVKAKEPKFNGRRGELSEFPDELQSSLSWNFGEAYVNVSIFDYYSENDAIKYFKMNYSENPMSPLRAYGGIRLTNLGDDAWLMVTDKKRKDGSAYIIMRKGSVIMIIEGTATTLTKRFARYLVREIEKRDRGEP